MALLHLLPNLQTEYRRLLLWMYPMLLPQRAHPQACWWRACSSSQTASMILNLK